MLYRIQQNVRFSAQPAPRSFNLHITSPNPPYRQISPPISGDRRTITPVPKRRNFKFILKIQ